MKALFLLIFLTSVAFAETPVRIRVVNSYGPGSIPRAQVSRLLDQVIGELRRETGQHLIFSRVEHRRNIWLKQINTCDFAHTYRTLNSIADWLDKRGWYQAAPHMKLAHFVLPPTVCDGTQWMLGWSFGCQWPGLSYFSAKYRQGNESRIAQSYVGIKHELSHSLGAQEADPEDANIANLLMNTDALYHARMPWALSNQDILDIDWCING
jgi:hypothetical protein